MTYSILPYAIIHVGVVRTIPNNLHVCNLLLFQTISDDCRNAILYKYDEKPT
jgi:hypothetical protein